MTSWLPYFTPIIFPNRAKNMFLTAPVTCIFSTTLDYHRVTNSSLNETKKFCSSMRYRCRVLPAALCTPRFLQFPTRLIKARHATVCGARITLPFRPRGTSTVATAGLHGFGNACKFITRGVFSAPLRRPPAGRLRTAPCTSFCVRRRGRYAFDGVYTSPTPGASV